MVREVELDYPLESCTPQVLYETVYAKKVSMQKYHLEVYGTKVVDVSDWENGQRMVTCSMPLSLPETVKTMIGGDSIPMVESQSITLHNNGDFVVLISPTLQIRGGSGYKTSAKIAVSASGSGGLMVNATVTCSAAGPWGMIGFIESIMVEQARTGMLKFLDYCKKEVLEQIPEQNQLTQHMRFDGYFDPQEAESECSFEESFGTCCFGPDGSVYSALSKTGGVATIRDAAVTDSLQKLLSASEEIQRNMRTLSEKVDRIKNFQSRLLWMDFALAASLGFLLWSQLRKHKA